MRFSCTILRCPNVGATHHSPRTRAKVIAEYRRTGRVDLACAHAGVDRTRHYQWLKKFPEYATEFESAREEVVGLMEDELIRRAYHGTMRPVSVGGVLTMVTEFSDRLMEFWMKSRARDVFGDRQEHTGKGGAPLFGGREETDRALAAYMAENDKGE